MKALTAPMHQLGEFEEIRRKIAGNRGMLQVTGCIDSQKSHFIYCAGENYSRIIITYSDLRAKEICENYRFFDRDVLYFPAKDLIFFQADIHSNLLEQQRISVLKALVEQKQVTVVTTMAACMNHLIPFEDWKSHILVIDSDSELDMEQLKKDLTAYGYERTGQVEGPGQFAVRGGIIDIYPLTEENPVRIELWGEEVDSIRSFDVESQRSIENLESVRIYPAAELIPDADQRRNAFEKIKKEADKAEKIFRKDGKQEEGARIRSLLRDCQDQL